MKGFERASGMHQESGRLFEEKVFGKARVDDMAAMVAEMHALPRDGQGRVKGGLKRLFEIFKKHHSGDPEDPIVPTARDLRYAAIDAFGLPEELAKHLRLYSMVGTPIDAMGHDAIVEYLDPKSGESVIVTLDATLRKDKLLEGGKADVIIGELPDAAQEEESFLAAIDDYGGEIAMALQDKMIEAADRRRVA